MIQANRLPLKTARRVAERLVDTLAPSCDQIAVAGSIRRERPDVGDIEVVAIPRLVATPAQLSLFDDAAPVQLSLFDDDSPAGSISALDAALEELLDQGRIFRSRHDALAAADLPVSGDDVRRWGERYKRFYLFAGAYGVVPVDLFLTTPDAWGAILAIRTGPGDFSKALVTRLKLHTPYRQQDGQVVFEATGEAVSVPSERAYFDLAGLAFVEPPGRNLAAFRQAAAAQESRQANKRAR